MLAGSISGISMTAAAEEGTVDGGGAVIKVLCHSSWRTDEANDVFDYVAEKCNVTFEFEEVPEGDSGNDLICAKIQSGEVPDILWWQGATTSSIYMGEDSFEELTGDWTQYFSDSIIDSAWQTYNGKILCAPFGDVCVFGMVYNKQVFADNNLEIPQTWDELLEDCEILKEAGIIPVYTSGAADNEWTLQIISIDARAKQGLLYPDTFEKLNKHEMLWADMEYENYALEKMMELIDNGYTNETFLSDTYADAQEALITGEAAMYPSATFITSEIRSISESDEEFENIGMFALPSQDADTAKAYLESATGFLIPKGGSQTELVQQIIGELCSPDAMSVYYANHTGIPSINGVDVEFTGIAKDVSEMIEAGDTFAAPEMVYSVPSLAKDVQAMVSGSKTPVEVLEGTDNDWDILAKEAGNSDWGY
jgi:ABC-type glycerol-3-phosphate transport system substrate-binding protein